MSASIADHIYEVASVILFGIGFTTLLLDRNLIKKIIGMNIMDTSVYLFLASMGYIAGRSAPIGSGTAPSSSDIINPVPAGLVLPGIVVSVSVTALMLALTVRLYHKYHTLDIDQIVTMARKEEDV